MFLRGRLGHQQKNQNLDRLLVGRIEANALRQLKNSGHGGFKALDAAMGNGDAVA
jgi:hypothetical protein